MGHTDWMWTERDAELQAALGWWNETFYRQMDKRDDGRIPLVGGPAHGGTCLASTRHPLAVVYADAESPLGWTLARVGETTSILSAGDMPILRPFLLDYGRAGAGIEDGTILLWNGSLCVPVPMVPLGVYVRTEQRGWRFWRKSDLAYQWQGIGDDPPSGAPRDSDVRHFLDRISRYRPTAPAPELSPRPSPSAV